MRVAMRPRQRISLPHAIPLDLETSRRDPINDYTLIRRQTIPEEIKEIRQSPPHGLGKTSVNRENRAARLFDVALAPCLRVGRRQRVHRPRRFLETRRQRPWRLVMRIAQILQKDAAVSCFGVANGGKAARRAAITAHRFRIKHGFTRE